MRLIVLIDSDPEGREWLTHKLAATGHPVRGFADAVTVQAELRPGEIEAIVIAIDQTPANGEGATQSVREVACWLRGAGAKPALFAIARRTLTPTALVAALHRGASTVITVDQIVILRELVEAQLRARDQWSNGSGSVVREGAAGEYGEPSMREVTLTPRLATADLPVNEPGWIPGRADFEITEADPIDLKLYESKAVLRAIAAADGNRTLAAQLLGIGKSTLYRRLSEWRASLS